MFKLWCGGKLCPEHINRIHLTCLYCRWRRKHIGKWTKPPYWIEYTYLSQSEEVEADYFMRDGVFYRSSDGGKLTQKHYFTLRIDPRGRFTQLRCCAVIVFDKIMKLTKIGKPIVEVCEMLANYPI